MYASQLRVATSNCPCCNGRADKCYAYYCSYLLTPIELARESVLGAGATLTTGRRGVQSPTQYGPLTPLWCRRCSASLCRAYQCNGVSHLAVGAAADSPAAGRYPAYEAATPVPGPEVHDAGAVPASDSHPLLQLLVVAVLPSAQSLPR